MWASTKHAGTWLTAVRMLLGAGASVNVAPGVTIDTPRQMLPIPAAGAVGRRAPNPLTYNSSCPWHACSGKPEPTLAISLQTEAHVAANSPSNGAQLKVQLA